MRSEAIRRVIRAYDDPDRPRLLLGALRHPAPALPRRDRPVPARRGAGARHRLRLRALLALLRGDAAAALPARPRPQRAPHRDGPARRRRAWASTTSPTRRATPATSRATARLRRRLHARHRPPRPARDACRRCSSSSPGAARGRPAARQGRGHAGPRSSAGSPGRSTGPWRRARRCTTGARRSCRGAAGGGGLPVRRHLMVDVLPVSPRPLRLRGAGRDAEPCWAPRRSTAGYGEIDILHDVSPRSCGPARSSASSGPTAPASPPPSRPSWASSRPPRAGCSSTATTSPASGPTSCSAAAWPTSPRAASCSRR